jgi:uncharacterized protein
MHSAEYWIEKLGLESHPEGGYFKETYKSEGFIEIGEGSPEVIGRRTFSTGIYFLLLKNNFSAFHKIKSDEMWHFYEGHAIEIFYFDLSGILNKILLGNNLDNGEVFQAVVPANCWFGSRMANDGDFALVGCTVAPGFDFEDFEMANREELLSLYPEHRDIIIQLTH